MLKGGVDLLKKFVLEGIPSLFTPFFPMNEYRVKETRIRYPHYVHPNQERLL